MPLSVSGIQATLEAKMIANGLIISGDHAQGKKLAKAIAETIFQEITSNALVTVATVGGPTAQAGTGTIS